MIGSSLVYEGQVHHLRVRPKRHALHYKVFSLLLDLDSIAPLAAKLRLFSFNRFNLFSVWTRDHGDGSAIPLKDQVTARLRQAGLAHAAVSVQMVCYPRILGYVFNPLTLYYCRDSEGQLAAIIYEVHNTFGERHAYILPVTRRDGALVTQSCRKAFYVSPFIAMESSYSFRISEPGDDISISIRQGDTDGPMLTARFDGHARPFSDRQLARLFFRYPLMTLKVIAGIHWEALRLLLKGVPLFRHSRQAQTKTAPQVPLHESDR